MTEPLTPDEEARLREHMRLSDGFGDEQWILALLATLDDARRENELLDNEWMKRVAAAMRPVRYALKGARGLALDHDEADLDIEFDRAIAIIDELTG